MHDLENRPIAVENAQFVDFIDTTEVACVLCVCMRVRGCVHGTCVYMCVYVHVHLYMCTCVYLMYLCIHNPLYYNT